MKGNEEKSRREVSDYKCDYTSNSKYQYYYLQDSTYARRSKITVNTTEWRQMKGNEEEPIQEESKYKCDYNVN